MASSAIEEQFKKIVGAVAQVLKVAGYNKAGTKFRRQIDGNLSLVEFQRSTSSAADSVKFTINVGILSGKLLQYWDPQKKIEKESVWSAHLRRRIGEFLPQEDDLWWMLTESTDVEAVCSEVISLIAEAAIPYLENHSSDEALLTMWESGCSPGITELQRQRNISQLARS